MLDLPGPNVSMVALHGTRKSVQLTQLIEDVLHAITADLSAQAAAGVHRYAVGQMHATLLGMEVDVIDGHVVNRWWRKHRGEQVSPDVLKLRDLVQMSIIDDHLFHVRFGGFPESYCRCRHRCPEALERWACPTGASGFHGLGGSTYENSFHAAAPGGVVIGGWSVRDAEAGRPFDHRLYEFRRAAETAGFLHKRHDGTRPFLRDDNCFIRLGTLCSPLGGGRLEAVRTAVRRDLSRRRPVFVRIAVDDVQILLYDDPSMDEAHILQKVALADFLRDPSSVLGFYEMILRRAAG